ncbi:hypothetical protein AB0J63_49710 [Streptosporangium canum]|uniref:hypothetical protein n=1 Tax=Streptosporangium canum TaxID=324952 RepID=UPI0034246DB3
MATASKIVTLNSTNSKDITSTESGIKLLSEFSHNVQNRGVTSEPRTLQALTAKYRVTSVNVADILPDSRCKRNQETLILPKNTAEIRYMAGSPDPQENTDPCLITVAWDDAPEPAVQDDPQATAKSVAVAPYSEMYQGYCASRKVTDEHWFEPCYQKYVTKYDGNPTWNYYAIDAYNTCVNTDEWTLLVSCGRGQQVDSPASTQWLDRAPLADQLGTGCRSISLSLGMGPISLGGSTNHCDLQRIYVYPEAGKMSSYWKGDSANGTRATRHRASVKAGQDDGRPVWTNWFNAKSCRADLYPLSCS